jgi:FAD binding domain
LAGDAAHLNHPLGGMGMNGGIHDAFNLSEKLVCVLREEASESELERYERQRCPIALEYVNKITIANKRNLEARDPEEQQRWRETMTRTSNDRALAREYLIQVSMIASLEKQPRLVKFAFSGHHHAQEEEMNARVCVGLLSWPWCPCLDLGNPFGAAVSMLLAVPRLLYTLLILSIYLFVFSMLRLSAFLVGF